MKTDKRVKLSEVRENALRITRETDARLDGERLVEAQARDGIELNDEAREVLDALREGGWSAGDFRFLAERAIRQPGELGTAVSYGAAGENCAARLIVAAAKITASVMESIR